MISCRDQWPWTKPGYITLTRRQSNNQWIGGIAAHPDPNNSEWKNSLENFSLRFLGSRWDPPHWLPSKGPHYQSGVLFISGGVIEGHFEGKTQREFQPRGSCSCTIMSRLTGHLQSTRKRPTLASNVLITPPILRIWHRRNTTCSWTEKQLKFRHFSSDAAVKAAAETWLDGQTFEFFFPLIRIKTRKQSKTKLHTFIRKKALNHLH